MTRLLIALAALGCADLLCRVPGTAGELLHLSRLHGARGARL